MSRYGDENYRNAEKAKITRAEKISADPEYRERISERLKRTLGVKAERDPEYRKKITEKAKATRLGHKEADPEFQEKINSKVSATCMERYGVDRPSRTPNAVKAARINSGRRSYEKYILGSPYDAPMFSMEEYLERSASNEKLPFKCKKCGHEFRAHHDNGFHSRCPVCFPRKAVSHTEKEIAEFIRSLGVLTEENNRTAISPYELDVYVPARKIAVEFDGVYWHDSENRPTRYHLMKTELCEKNGIQLIHIFENEWNSSREIVKSRLKNLLGIYDRTVYARKCGVKAVSPEESRAFQALNHIQGAVNSKVNLGLYLGDELLGLMTFSRPRFSRKYEWELVRFCCKAGCHVPGAAGKLLKHFERAYRPSAIISYADRRWSTGKLYKALGFALDHVSKPDYWYFKDRYVLESRLKYQKHKLGRLLETFDPAKSEVENMKLNGYRRIFDCGNLVFVKKF